MPLVHNHSFGKRPISMSAVTRRIPDVCIIYFHELLVNLACLITLTVRLSEGTLLQWKMDDFPHLNLNEHFCVYIYLQQYTMFYGHRQRWNMNL